MRSSGRLAVKWATCVLVMAILCCVNLLSSTGQTTTRFTLDPSQSKFIAHVSAGGLLWFEGHDHYLAARKFSGEVKMTPNQITPASLRLVVQADSLEETGKDFTDAQKQIINKEVREIVLQPAQYPEIVFQSASVVAKPAGAGEYELQIVGDLTLHGVTKRLTIPSKLKLEGENIRATGEFKIDRDDFNVKATSAVHGLVRVKDTVRLEFDIVGHRQ